jgi:hypothetical protein
MSEISLYKILLETDVNAKTVVINTLASYCGEHEKLFITNTRKDRIIMTKGLDEIIKNDLNTNTCYGANSIFHQMSGIGESIFRCIETINHYKKSKKEIDSTAKARAIELVRILDECRTFPIDKLLAIRLLISTEPPMLL